MCRFMGVSKRAVTNKARVEGSICTDYVHREIANLLAHYFSSFNLVPTTSLSNNSCSESVVIHPTLSILHNSGRPGGKSGKHYLTDEEWKSAHVHVLINCDEIKPYLE